MPTHIHLRRSEVLGFGAVLEQELHGLRLGALSPTRILNARTGLNWSAAQWFQALKPYYLPMIAPASRDS